MFESMLRLQIDDACHDATDHPTSTLKALRRHPAPQDRPLAPRGKFSAEGNSPDFLVGDLAALRVAGRNFEDMATKWRLQTTVCGDSL